MIIDFVTQFEANKATIRETFQQWIINHNLEWDDGSRIEDQICYLNIVKEVAKHLNPLDPERVTEIDHGDYQGTLLYVIGRQDYQPDEYWYVKVSYGSCSVCDTLEAALHHANESNCVDDLMTLALHVVQGLKVMQDVYDDPDGDDTST